MVVELGAEAADLAPEDAMQIGLALFQLGVEGQQDATIWESFHQVDPEMALLAIRTLYQFRNERIRQKVEKLLKNLT